MRAWIAPLVLLVLGTVPAAGQAPRPGEPANPYGSGAGFTVLITNSGFGLGGYVQRSVTPTASLIAELNLGSGKNEREFAFSDFLGRRTIPNKANYLLVLPVQVGWQQRLFRDAIEDNFRPYVQVIGGPVLGWEYPYFEDCDGDGERSPEPVCEDGSAERIYDAFGSLGQGSLHLGVSGMIVVGAHFGLSRRVTQGLRVGYVVHHFFEGVQLLEPSVQGPQQFFGSPVISLTFGRLW